MPFIFMFSNTDVGSRELDLAANWDSSREEIQGSQADWWTFLKTETKTKDCDELEHNSVDWNMRGQAD